MIQSVTYLNFHNTLEVLNFYERNLGATIITQVMGDHEMFKEMPEELRMPEEVAKQFVMNSEFEILGNTFMASDTWGQKPVDQEASSICFTFDGKSSEEVEKITNFYQHALEIGCKETMPWGPTEWTSHFGMFDDPFGITWMFSAI